MMRPALSLVFPAWNEAENLPALLESALAIGAQLGVEFEIVIVDDGSADASREVLDGWCRRDARVRAVHHPENQGYGAALRAGLKTARGEFVFFSDADLQFELGEIRSLLDHADEYEIVAGYRAPRRDPWLRRLIAAVWGALVRGLFDLPVRDIDCAFKVFHRSVLEAIPIQSVGAFVNTEILVRARAAYAEGAGIYRILPIAVCRPEDIADLVKLIRWAAESGVGLVPRGAGSGMTGGNVGEGVVVDLNGITERPLEIDPIRRTARTGAQVTLAELNAAAGKHGLRLPPDPSSGGWATVGGVIGTNASGPRTLKYGSVRRWVESVEMVLAGGEQITLVRGKGIQWTAR